MNSSLFLKLITGNRRFQSEEHEKAWLIVTASNTCKDALKHWRRKVENIDDYPSLSDTVSVPENAVLSEILALPVKYREVVYLYYYEGFQTAEISKMLHCSDSTVRNRLARARKRLKDILSSPPEEFTGRKESMRKAKSKRILRIAAAVAVAVMLPGAAYADGSIAAKIGNEPTEFREEYGAYSCYTREMADKIDELCEKYQLKKREEPVIEDDYKKILSKYGIGDILKPSEDMVNMMQGEVCDSDGNFNLGGEITFPENPGCSIVYELNRSVKGFFDTTVLNVGNVDDYEQWEYETENGETVLLARNGDKALIIADKEKSFISVNMDGYFRKEANGIGVPYEISKEELEKIADSLDFR